MLDYGGSFSEKNLRRMIQFAEVFPDEEILVSLIRHLSWQEYSFSISRHSGAGRNPVFLQIVLDPGLRRGDESRPG